ncbi:hypothetical protein M378DRAFT_187100 [Amanita muscaria Koide BX008]|uniref:Nickel/cobalt efflux system n=1 Tax=Amanita muscaria (strain Koide BX008) TaxID=946122 RepID=A0A0C2T9A4_AMAMK|nr:hypothetical protein M378DRAFT_187100 [Amanita muscaria Koide BX008]
MAFRLTLLGRSVLLIALELLANALSWSIAAILFARKTDTRPLLSYALLAWTFGLRHALDADHISAIDNATRTLIGLGQLPVTCGLYFSLGHSTIVIIVTVAIAVSASVYQHFNGANDVGGIIGASVSGAFLFIVAVANTIILWKILKRRRKVRSNRTLMLRILGPVINFVNRPWKMYPVGVLFGLSFDTASSIALIAVSAIAHKGAHGTTIPSSNVVILPVLFTAGMTLVDSADSVLVLYSYAGFPNTPSWALFARTEAVNAEFIEEEKSEIVDGNHGLVITAEESPRISQDTQIKTNAMSNLSIGLTLMSILVALAISLITIMSLVGERCSQCAAAANAKDGGGLAGSWWRAWARANDNLGYIGVAIIGIFFIIAIGWFTGRRLKDRVHARIT